MADTFTLGGHEFTSRFILGSGKYSLDLIKAAVEYAGAQIVTLALRRATLGSIDNILDYIPENVTLKQLDGKKITFKDAVQQGPVIISFWATWCKPCQSELEALKDLEDSWKNKVRIIAVSIDDARAMAKVKSLVKGKKWPFEVLLDPNKELYKAFNISAIPYVLVINDKKVVWTHSGYMPGNEVLVVDKALETIGKK